jgi:hypothetical protein
MARRRRAVRRRRLLLTLTFGAAVTLAVAVLTSSLFWLGLTVIFDLLIGAYVTLLLMARQRAFAVAMAPRIGSIPAAVEEPSAAARREATQSSSTVRVVAG